MKKEELLKIFIVDDDPFWIELLTGLLRELGYTHIEGFESGSACLENLHHNPEVVFLDYQMEEVDGISTLKGIKNYYPGAFVIFTTGMEDLKVAVEAMKFGAFDYLLKTNITKKEVKDIFQKMKASLVKTGKVF